MYFRLSEISRMVRVLGPALALVVAACQPETPAPIEPTPTTTPSLVPYQSPVIDPTLEQPLVLPAATRTPQPTPTPFTYTVEEGDTLLTIAFRFSVSVDDIVAVNPGVDSRFLSIGQDLVIPIGEGPEAVIASPTPVPLKRGAPTCYPATEGGVWCFVPVLNELPVPVEGVEAEISLYGFDGQRLSVQIAHAPLNQIGGGEVVPLAAYFPAPLPEQFLPRVHLRQAFVPGPSEGQPRYLAHEISSLRWEIGADSLQGRVRGVISLQEPGGEPNALLIKLVAVAYSTEDFVVGMRAWELPADSQAVLDGLAFNFWVYSLGPPIDEIELLSEIRFSPISTPEPTP